MKKKIKIKEKKEVWIILFNNIFKWNKINKQDLNLIDYKNNIKQLQ